MEDSGRTGQTRCWEPVTFRKRKTDSQSREQRGNKPTVLALTPESTPSGLQSMPSEHLLKKAMAHLCLMIGLGQGLQAGPATRRLLSRAWLNREQHLPWGPPFFMEFVLALIEKVPLEWEIIKQTPEFKSPLPISFCAVWYRLRHRI